MKKLSVFTVLVGLTIVLIPINLYAGWIFTFGGADTDGGQSVCESPDGGFVTAGQTGESLLLVKTSSTGDLVWDHSYAEMIGISVIPASDGGYVITGSKDDRWLGQTLFIMKTGSGGDSSWIKIHGKEGCEGNAILPTSDGGYLLTGTNGKLWIIKTDSQGELVWEKEYGESGRGYAIREIAAGGYAITGTVKLADERDDLCVLKIDGAGDTAWLKTYGKTDDYEHGHSIEPTSDGGFFIAGQYGSDTWLVKTDSEGDTAWTKIEKTGRTNQLVETSDGNYILTGMRYAGVTKHDLLILKIDANGNKLWQKTYGGTSDDIGYSIKEASEGGFIAAGQTRSYGSGGFDLWMVRTNSAGDTLAVMEEVSLISNMEIVTTVGSNLTLRYTESPNGFFADIYDASGAKVDEIISPQSSGTVTWGLGQESGVYFIVPRGIEVPARKVVLVR